MIVEAQFQHIVANAEVAAALVQMGYQTPTPVQQQAIPILQQGQDALIEAATGTGKTAAFGIPMIERILKSASKKRTPRALVICPTRELAQQVALELGEIAARTPLRVVCVYGGAPEHGQIQGLRAGAQIVVGTPGRLLDLEEKGALALHTVDMVVLDEADRLLDVGFAPDVTRIVRKTNKVRQSVLCSATLSDEVKLFARSLSVSGEFVQIKVEVPPEARHGRAHQYYYEVLAQEKMDALISLLDQDTTSPIYGAQSVLVFRRTQIGVEKLAQNLMRRRYQADFLHGGLSQPARERVLSKFKAGGLRILVTTNVAARGIDIDDLEAVVSYDIPEDVETYVHRIGRTARAGKSGVAIIFQEAWDPIEVLDAIKEKMGEDLRQLHLHWYRDEQDVAGK